MNTTSWLRDSAADIRRNGVDGVRRMGFDVYKKLLQVWFDANVSGTPIYSREWDLIVILDGCRADLMAEVADDYAFIETVETVPSLDTMTAQWMQKNFVESYAAQMAETAYITGNPFSGVHLDGAQFHLLDEVWRYAWDDEVGTVHPRPITDGAIQACRDDRPERVVVHYMQPHYPFVHAPDLGQGIQIETFGTEPDDSIWQQLQRDPDAFDKDEVWAAYRENLEYVLDDVELLLDNVDAERAVISADHGNATGELGIYGHPARMPIESLYRVPWVETTATDTHSHDPEDHGERQSGTIEDRLAALGYTE